ncbi:MAG: hypothetical protein V8R01_01790 [Bacilli bacterium]
MLITIVKSYKSSVLNQRVVPTPVDNEGNPKYAIYVEEERALALIEAGVAEEYVLEEVSVESDNKDENSTNTDDDTNKTPDENTPNDETTDKKDLESSEETKKETGKTKSNNKKNK